MDASSESESSDGSFLPQTPHNSLESLPQTRSEATYPQPGASDDATGISEGSVVIQVDPLPAGGPRLLKSISMPEPQPAEPRPPPTLTKSVSERGPSRTIRRSDRIAKVGSLFASLRRSISRIGMTETFYCGICLENENVDGAYALSQCGHKFCKECLVQWLSFEVSQGHVTEISCPYSSECEPCQCCVVDEDMEELLSEEVLEKYHRFKLQRENINYRACPRCEHMQVGKVRHPLMECEECGHGFCFVHSDQHPGMSCKQWERNAHSHRLEEDMDAQSAALVRSISVQCPGCERPVLKSSGCNHMTCSVCRTNFCWLCGAQVENDCFPRHYKWWNLCGCANLQMREGMAPNQKCKMYLWRILLLLMYLVGTPIAIGLGGALLGLFLAVGAIWLALFIVCFPVTLCCVCFADDSEDVWRVACCFPVCVRDAFD